MESMNKFKVLTIVVICLFVFAIGAIYSNTKDVTAGKAKQQETETTDNQNSENNSYSESANDNTAESTQDIQTLSAEIENINQRIDELSQKVNTDNSSSLNCKIIGSMGDNGIEQLSEDAVLQEAKVNNRDIVITCSF